ncbi:MAG: ATP-dependent DNA helicase RecG [Candidatus Omnitrophota bacterium]
MLTTTTKQSLSDISARYVKGVGPVKAETLKKLEIETVDDLLYHFPRRYEDRSKFKPISQVKVGEYQTIKGEILTIGGHRAGKGRTIFKAAVGDNTGIIYAVWFNQPYMKKWLKNGDKIILYGKVERYKDIQMNSPEFEIVNDEGAETIHTGRIVPIYPLTEGVGQRSLRTAIKNALERYSSYICDTLPFDMLKRRNLMGLRKAVLNMHFPDSEALNKMAYDRVVFEEFFILQLALALRRMRLKEQNNGVAHKIEGGLSESFKAILPFKLTEAQDRVIQEISVDMASPKPMNRLLQGDVGSGKTMVAAYSLILTAQNGYQGALMVPTEILAQQHFINLSRLLSPLGVNIVLLTNGVSDEERKRVNSAIEDGSANIIVGTHALIQEDVKFKNLGLVVIDEQHKFGVDQRARLKEKGFNPDMLFMTATPIPRTLAMTLYGDLDISVLDQMPEGRIPPKAYWVGEDRRQGVYKFIAQEAASGSQALIICPLIEKSEKDRAEDCRYISGKQDSSSDLKAANEIFVKFRDDIFSQFNVGLIHGRLDDDKKRGAMEDFKSGKIRILVSTTVVEVGIDNPNVSVMLVENPERFGLSQLHQLRGRLGRGGQKSYCILISDTESEQASRRLKALINTSSGFDIAEEDLEIRGPGEFFGTKQHGLPELRYANLVSDVRQLEAARQEALNLLRDDPRLSAPPHKLLKENLRRKFKDKFDIRA